jgi:hypothetical protein
MMGGPGGYIDPFPEQAYSVGLDASAAFQFTPRWSLMGGSTLGFFTNFQDLGTDDVFQHGLVRAPGRLLLMYRPRETLTIALGVMYLDNNDLDWLPTGGVVWTPSDRWRMELLFPRSRVFYRIRESLSVYGLFQFANNLYGVGEPDPLHPWYRQGQLAANPVFRGMMEYEDFRAGLGVDWTISSRVALSGEVGAAFLRSVGYMRRGEYDLEPTLYLKTGIRF